MNKQDRKELEKSLEAMRKAYDIISAHVETIEQMRDSEQEKFDNLSEGLQQSERGSRIEDAVSKLEDALQSIETAQEETDNCINALQEAIDS